MNEDLTPGEVVQLKAIRHITRWLQSLVIPRKAACFAATKHQVMDPASYGHHVAFLYREVTCYRNSGHRGQHRNGKLQWK